MEAKRRQSASAFDFNPCLPISPCQRENFFYDSRVPEISSQTSE
jgi:hypothetical protein